jgi:UDP-glucose 4-epimerase
MNKNRQMRVLVSGMGGQLGTLIARRLESIDAIEAIFGYDLDPPRRRLRRAEFRRIDPSEPSLVADAVRDFDPTAVVHLGLYEPHARLEPNAARAATRLGNAALVAALGDAANLESIVVRSGIEVYGRRRGGPIRPDEDATPMPTTDFGRCLLEAEGVLVALGAERDIPVASLRCASIVGSHTPSPLGRLLKLAAIPVPAMADPAFTMLHAEDAADAILAALLRQVRGPLNVVAPGAVTPWQATRIGGRVPIPVLGAGWAAAKVVAEIAGAPLPDQVRELLVRGRVVDGGRCADVLGIEPQHSAREILTELYEQSNVVYLSPRDAAAA